MPSFSTPAHHKRLPSKLVTVFCVTLLTSACNGAEMTSDSSLNNGTNRASPNSHQDAQPTQTKQPTFIQQQLASFSEPWAVAVVADSDNQPRQLLVTQKSGELYVLDLATGDQIAVAGVPAVAYGGQGGLGDVILAPDFAATANIYLSYVEAGEGGTRGAKVIQATLSGLASVGSDNPTVSLSDLQTIWTQTPKTTGTGHYSHRLVISPDQQHLFITSGDRQKLDPAQDMSSSLGKTIRLHLDGSIPTDNPYTDSGTLARSFWSVGHRNGLGMAFDDDGRLWQIEMGPRGGDELNLIQSGRNYGWPLVSEGKHYSGVDIPNHSSRPEFEPPKIAWTPVISPASISIYRGDAFADWRGKALLSGLSSQSLVVVDLGDAQTPPSEAYRYDLGTRLRNVSSHGDSVYLLEDGKDAKLWQLQPQ